MPKSVSFTYAPDSIEEKSRACVLSLFSFVGVLFVLTKSALPLLFLPTLFFLREKKGPLFCFLFFSFFALATDWYQEIPSTYSGRVKLSPLYQNERGGGNRKALFQVLELSDRSVEAKNVKVSAKLPPHVSLPRAPFFAKGVLSKKNSGKHTFCFDPIDPKVVPAESKLSTYRKNLKEMLKNTLLRNLKERKSALFLFGMLSGEFSDLETKSSLSRFGLQHIMAISGFHVSLMIVFSFSLLSLFFRKDIAHALTFFLLIAYFAFVGMSPSILRAFLCYALFFIARLLKRDQNPIQALGIALMISLLLNPFYALHIGFQFSFATTLSLLLFLPRIENRLKSYLASYKRSSIAKMDRIDQHLFFLLSFIRDSFSLTLSVSLTALPLSLFLFETFSITGIAFNLFYPLFVTISLYLLFFSVFLTPFPSIQSALLDGVSFFTKTTLNLTLNAPGSLEITLNFFVSKLLLSLFFLGLVLFVIKYPLRKLNDTDVGMEVF